MDQLPGVPCSSTATPWAPTTVSVLGTKAQSPGLCQVADALGVLRWPVDTAQERACIQRASAWLSKKSKQLSAVNWPRDPKFPTQCPGGSRTCFASCIETTAWPRPGGGATLRPRHGWARFSGTRNHHERRTDPTRPSPMGQRWHHRDPRSNGRRDGSDHLYAAQELPVGCYWSRHYPCVRAQHNGPKRGHAHARAPRHWAVKQENDQHWGDIARSDWGSAVVVALVLTVATLIAAIAIAAFDNSARLASRYSTITSELPRTAQAGGSSETDGRAR